MNVSEPTNSSSGCSSRRMHRITRIAIQIQTSPRIQRGFMFLQLFLFSFSLALVLLLFLPQACGVHSACNFLRQVPQFPFVVLFVLVASSSILRTPGKGSENVIAVDLYKFWSCCAINGMFRQWPPHHIQIFLLRFEISFREGGNYAVPSWHLQIQIGCRTATIFIRVQH